MVPVGEKSFTSGREAPHRRRTAVWLLAASDMGQGQESQQPPHTCTLTLKGVGERLCPDYVGGQANLAPLRGLIPGPVGLHSSGMRPKQIVAGPAMYNQRGAESCPVSAQGRPHCAGREADIKSLCSPKM